MKVLFVNINDSSGGAARAAMRIMCGVQRSGVEAQMFVKNKYTQAKDVISIRQYIPSNLIYKCADWIVQKIKNQWQHMKWNPYQRTKQDAYLSDLRSTSIHGALQKLDYEIVHLHWINMRFLNIKELAKIKKPIVWTLHDSWPFTGICHVPYECKNYETHCSACPVLGSGKEKDLAYEVFEKKLAAYKDLNLHVVTPSRWLGDRARRSTLFGQYPVSIIPNCIDTDLFMPFGKQEARQALGLDSMKTYLLFGAMHAIEDGNKGFAYLKDALKHMSGTNIELMVYGTNDDMERYGLPIPVRSLGYISNDKMMVLVYNAADVCVVPSLSENLSNTIMESLSCGTPVVAFNIGGNGDMVDHKQNGYLARERDRADLAKGIEWCINNNNDSAIGRAAREKVLQNFTIEIVAEQYKKLYESLV